MTEVILIGTLHAGLTPNKELEEVILSLSPNKILVEICQDDIDKDNLKEYPEEMVFALNWSLKNKVEVKGFDVHIDIKIEDENCNNAELIEESKRKIKDYNWKEMNDRNKIRLLDFIDNHINLDKERERELGMLDNINKEIKIFNGIVLIITGVGHLDFFGKHMKGVKFLFRK